MANIDINRRAVIEAHVEACRDAAKTNVIEMGRWLCRAKDENVVPHGEWEAWLREHAEMSERGAQRLMQIAREIPEGSPLERLGISKLDILLAIPAADREQFAETVDAEHASTRQLSRDVNEARRAARGAPDGKGTALDAAEALRVAEAAREETGRVREQLEQARGDLERTRQQLAIERRRPETTIVEKIPDDYPELKKRLAAAEAEADRLADELDRAKLASAGGEDDLISRIVSTIGGFMTQAAMMPQRIRDAGDVADDESINVLLGQLRTVRAWCDALRDALMDQPRFRG